MKIDLFHGDYSNEINPVMISNPFKHVGIMARPNFPPISDKLVIVYFSVICFLRGLFTKSTDLKQYDFQAP